MDPALEKEFEQLRQRSPWMASFVIDGQVYGYGRNHHDDEDARVPQFFQLVGTPRRILELGSCQGGGTFQLARHPGVQEVVGIEGRDYHFEKAQLVRKALGASNVTFLHRDLESFDFSRLGRFDATYCVGVLYHLPRPWELLARLAPVTDVLYLNTHYCPRKEVEMALGGYEGKKWLEGGYDDPLSGLSAWSFWPTLEALCEMLLDNGFLPEIFETDTLGPGQSPHGATIVARRRVAVGEEEADMWLRKMRQVLAALPASAGAIEQGACPSRARRILSRLKRIVGR
jgi:SAM-dependent methyltransferase